MAAHTRKPIPGEHDHSSEAPPEPGIVGTTGYGGDLPVSPVDPTIDEKTRRQIRWEAGGKTPGEHHSDEQGNKKD